MERRRCVSVVVNRRHSRNHESGAAPAIKEGQKETREKAAESTERGDSDL